MPRARSTRASPVRRRRSKRSGRRNSHVSTPWNGIFRSSKLIRDVFLTRTEYQRDPNPFEVLRVKDKDTFELNITKPQEIDNFVLMLMTGDGLSYFPNPDFLLYEDFSQTSLSYTYHNKSYSIPVKTFDTVFKNKVEHLDMTNAYGIIPPYYITEKYHKDIKIVSLWDYQLRDDRTISEMSWYNFETLKVYHVDQDVVPPQKLKVQKRGTIEQNLGHMTHFVTTFQRESEMLTNSTRIIGKGIADRIDKLKTSSTNWRRPYRDQS